MVYDPTLFNIHPFYDDYDDTKKYLRLLFKPGYAVQARELTQLQTGIQDQIARLGNHIFVNGSRVLGGEISTQDVSFIRVSPLDPTGTGGLLNLNNFIGLDLVAPESQDSRRARVLHGLSGGTGDSDNSYILFIQYLNGGSGGAVEFGANELVTGASGDNTFTALMMSEVSSITGSAKLVTIDNGVYFYDGYFVKTDKTSIAPYGITNSIRDFSSPTSRIGFLADRQIVTSDDDVTLRDPASGAYNYNAPGADRFKIDLKLHFINFTNSSTVGASGYTDANFVELLRFVNGGVVIKKDISIYSEIEKTLARRTYDESGSYTVKPFEIDLRESLDTLGGPLTSADGGTVEKLAAEILPGKAYVFGYEFETLAPRYSLIDKGRSAGNGSNQPMNTVQFGQYVKVKSNASGSLTGGIDFVNNHPTIVLNSDGGQTGSARIRTIIANNDTVGMTSDTQSYNMYLFDVNLGGITAFGHIASFGGTALSSSGVTAKFAPASGGTGHSNGVTGTLLFNPDANSALFPAPIGSAVKSVTNLTYRVQKGFTFTQTSASTVISLSSGDEDISFTGILDTLNTGDKKTHYLLISNGSTGPYGSTGERVNTDSIAFIRSGGNKILSIGHATNATEQLPVGSYSLIATLDVSNPSSQSALFRQKTFISGSSSGYIRTSGESSGLSGSTGAYYLALDHVDVYNITSVIDNNGDVSTRLGLDVDADIKSAFLFDNGQRDNYYDFAKLYLNPAHGTGGGSITGDINLTITYDRFEHGSGVGPFTVNSYTHSSSNFNYDTIPIYTSPATGKSYALRNCVDFRGTAQSNGNIAPTGLLPKTGQDFRISHEYYLSRVDKVVLTKEREFDVIRGIPGLNPQTPPDREDAMTLYVITVPAYTFNPTDVSIKYIENKRYTMRDIGLIEKRVENLEYYTSLSLLEQQTEARTITNEAGADIFKNGILVDSFRGHGVGDVLNADYKCSIDPENGHLRPPFTSNGMKLNQVSNISGLTQQPDGTVLLNYEIYNQFVWQPLASGNIQVNAFGIPTFMGYVDFNDQFDGWYDTSNQPKVKINTQGENDRWKVNNSSSGYGFGTQWNDWESIWSGRTVTQSDLYGNMGRDILNEFATGVTTSSMEARITLAESSAIRSTETLRNQESRVGIRVRKLPERLEKVVNGKLVDVSVVPYIQSKTVTLSAYGLKPNTQVYPFFDGAAVSVYCGPTGGASAGALYTDSQGRILDMFFSIPLTTFRTGEKIFRLTDNGSNIVSATTTAADGIYYALGTVQQRDGNVTSTRPVVSRRQVANDEAIVKDAFDRAQYINTHANSTWIDPLAQSFSVDRDYYQNGVFVHSVDLFFYERDENLPITLELRPTLNGYPHLSHSLPFSTVTLIPNAIEVSTTTNEEKYTRFTFPSPVYLNSGEYAICLKTASDKYRLYHAEIGGVQLDTGTLIVQQPYAGALFTPHNTGIAVANTNKNLKFKINACQFQTTGSAQFGLSSADFASIIVDTFKLNSGELQPRTTSIGYDFDLGNLSNIQVLANENIYLEDPEALSDDADFSVDANFTTGDTFVSPVIDLERFDLIAVSNTVNNSADTTTNGELSASGHGTESSLYGSGTANPLLTPGCASKYITRRVSLADGFESTNFKVILGVNKPAAATIQVFIKALAHEEDYISFEDVGYVQMTTSTTIPHATNDYDFTDVTYSLSTNFVKPIKTFAVKICMYSSSSTEVPAIRDFRTIALAG